MHGAVPPPWAFAPWPGRAERAATQRPCPAPTSRSAAWPTCARYARPGRRTARSTNSTTRPRCVARPGGWACAVSTRWPFHAHRKDIVVEFNGVVPRRVNDIRADHARRLDLRSQSGRDVPLFAAPALGAQLERRGAAPTSGSCRGQSIAGLLNEAIYTIGDEEIAWILGAAPIASVNDRLERRRRPAQAGRPALPVGATPGLPC